MKQKKIILGSVSLFFLFFLFLVISFSGKEPLKREVSMERDYVLGDLSGYNAKEEKDGLLVSKEGMPFSFSLSKEWSVSEENKNTLLFSKNCDVYLTATKEELFAKDLYETASLIFEEEIEREDITTVKIGDFFVLDYGYLARIPQKNTVYEIGAVNNQKTECLVDYKEALNSITFNDE